VSAKAGQEALGYREKIEDTDLSDSERENTEGGEASLLMLTHKSPEKSPSLSTADPRNSDQARDEN
jgi:hypothetical protein